jgi:hypothetical protein
MPKDVIVVVDIDAKPRASEALDILMVSTAGAKDVATYRSLDEVKAAFPDVAGAPQKIYRKAEALFNQGKTTLADTLIRKVKIVGLAAPAGEDDAAKAADLVEKIETFQETDNDWYILVADVDGESTSKPCASLQRTANPRKPSSVPELKTTGSSTSGRRQHRARGHEPQMRPYLHHHGKPRRGSRCRLSG